MPRRRLQRQERVQDKNQIQSERLDNHSRFKRRRIAVLLLVTLIGGVIGYFSLPSHVSDIVDPGYFLSAEGSRFFAASGGCIVFLILMAMLYAGIDAIRQERISRRALFGWSVTYLIAAIVGSLIGYAYLPHILLAFARILLGASLGIFGPGLLIVFLTHPQAVFEGVVERIFEIGLERCLDGCFSFTCVLLISMIGVVGGLFIWHSFFLSALTGGSALITLITFVRVVFPRRKNRVAYERPGEPRQSIREGSGVENASSIISRWDRRRPSGNASCEKNLASITSLESS